MRTAILDVGGTLIGAPNLFAEMAGIFNSTVNRNQIISDLKTTFNQKFKLQRETDNEFLTVEQIIKQTLNEVSVKYDSGDKGQFAESLYHDVFVNKSHLYPDTLPFLKGLRDAGTRILVASDADAWLIHKEFKKFKIADYFDEYCISSDVNAYKPTDKFVNAFKRKFSFDTSKAIMVGDAVADIMFGKKLKVKTAFINREEKHNDMKSDYPVTDLRLLLQYF